ncbi:serine/threonine-protein kinase Nek5-like isoform X2 [Achlya hypogyna]|uniref:non-specific serine/threonine protein kinase n=1 Tax=Achlya hypogyna TaxID=1202772 RepID=A0A1V9ZGC7_ACHHY|nr:serine/threonine-protein kinase Nek5-like isoform X2 [Achlya hypogyna]
MTQTIVVAGRTYGISETLESDQLDALFSDAWTGSLVWRASIFLSSQLARLQGDGAFTAGSTVIELGSGCGLVGLVAQDLGAAHVVVTDQEEIVGLLEHNIALNGPRDLTAIRAEQFNWGSNTFRDLWVNDQPFDYIVVSDCINPIYGVESWRNLAKSIRDLGGAHTVCYLSYEERGDNAALADFQACSAAYLHHELVLRDGSILLYRITPRPTMEAYARIRLLGGGSFGNVYLMREKAVGGGLVCVKDIGVGSKGALRDGVNEATLMARLDHPNVIAYKDAFAARNHRHYYIVMQYCAGGDLHAKILAQPQPFPEHVVTLIFAQVSLGLHCMHAAGIMHRDLKSHNVFVATGGQYILGDLGISRELGEDMAATVVGTPFFMAPEQCTGDRYGFPADVWSLGCLLYELCALAYPFAGATTPALMLHICAGSYAPLPRDVSFPLQKLVAQMLAVEPGQRPAVADVLRSPVLRPALVSYAHHVRKRGARSHVEVLRSQFRSLDMPDVWADSARVSQQRADGVEIPTPQYKYSEADMAAWLEKERERHLRLVLDHIKARRALAPPNPTPAVRSAPPQPTAANFSPRPEMGTDPEWQAPVQAVPRPLPAPRYRAEVAVGAFRKGVPLTAQAKPYLAMACKDVRVLRAQAYAEAAKAREFALATADEARAAWQQLQSDVETQLAACLT